MRNLMIAAVAATTLSLGLAAVPAHADSAPNYVEVRRVLETMGLLGTWGVDCNAMPSSTEWETIEVTDKGVVQSVEGGDDVISTYLIIDARRLNSREVRMRLLYVPEEGPDSEGDDYSPDQVTTVVYRVEGDRQMTWSSVGASGEPLITDGVFIGGDGEDGSGRSKWYNRCPRGVPTP